MELAGTYTIDSTIPISGTNFQTFTAFATSINTNGINGSVIVNVSNNVLGEYDDQQVTFMGIAGTNSTDTITINGNGATLSYNSSNTNNRAGIRFDGTAYFTVNDLKVTATGDYGFLIQLLSGSNNITISNCILTNPSDSSSLNYFGIIVNGTNSDYDVPSTNADNNTFENNTIDGGYCSILILGDNGQNNKIIGNTCKDFYSIGIQIVDQTNVIIEHNDISRPTRQFVDIITLYIFSSSGLRSGIISKNKLHDPYTSIVQDAGNYLYGIVIINSDASLINPNIISNNLIYNFFGSGDKRALLTLDSPYSRFYHNTISIDDTLYPSLTIGYNQELGNNIRLYNNIITLTGNAGPTYAIILIDDAIIDSNNNDLYVNGTGSNKYIGNASGTDYATLTDWTNATGYDMNSKDLDPIYTDILTNNYIPTNSQIDNMGTNVGITTDIDNNSRSLTTPDVGAYEFYLICFLRGSLVRCLVDGEEIDVPIENLTKDSLVKTLKNGYLSINIIGKSKIYNPKGKDRIKNRLYRLSCDNYSDLKSDLVMTGGHSILVKQLSEFERAETISHLGQLYFTDGHYRLMALIDKQAEPFEDEGVHEIYNIALNNDNELTNYGIYVNGLLVESCCIYGIKNYMQNTTN